MRILYFVAFLFITSAAFSQAHIYKFKLVGIEDAQDLKAAKDILYKIFDETPDYNPYTYYFTVKSDTEIDFLLLTGKMAPLGFEVTFFQKSEVGIVNENEKEN
ncbi:MAG: hypothetical protein ACKVPJ_05735 [Chitinophagales bacterium]